MKLYRKIYIYIYYSVEADMAELEKSVEAYMAELEKSVEADMAEL